MQGRGSQQEPRPCGIYGIEVLAAAWPALTRRVAVQVRPVSFCGKSEGNDDGPAVEGIKRKVQVPRASLVGRDAPVVDRRARWHAKPERRVRFPPGALVQGTGIRGQRLLAPVP